MDKDDFIVSALDRINAKIDKHDDKIDMIVTALQQLVKIDTENKELKETQIHILKKIEQIEHDLHYTGGSALTSFIAMRGEQLKNIEHILQEYKEQFEDFETRVLSIEKRGGKTWEAISYKVVEWVVLFGLGAIAFKFGIK